MGKYLILSLFFGITFLGGQKALCTKLEVNSTFLSSNPSIHRFYPSGAEIQPTSFECRSDLVSEILDSRQLSLKQKSENLQSYFNICENKIIPPTDIRSINSLIRYLSVEYKISEPKMFVKNVKIELNDGRIIRGFLGLQNSQIKRPLIIVKSGVFSNADENSVFSNLMIHLFDEAKFNVLYLSNVTGSEFQSENGSIAVGGMDEGGQIFEIAQYIKFSSEYRAHFSSLHVLGVSLGGNAALFSTIYDSYASQSSKTIDSVLAICPVVDLEKSLARLSKNDLLSKGASYVAFQSIKNGARKIPILNSMLNQAKWYEFKSVFTILKNSALTFYKQWNEYSEYDHPPFNQIAISNFKDLWHYNNYRNFYLATKIPTLLVAAENDEIVFTDQNAKTIND